jgi:adenylate cyclase
MKLPFRVAILGVLVTLILGTVAIVGISSYISARLASNDLAGQIIDQVSGSIDDQIEHLLASATDRAAITVGLLKSGQISKTDPERLLNFWARALETSPEITSYFIGSAETGESSGVSRLQGEALSIWQTERNAESGLLRLREFHLPDYPRSPFREVSGTEVSDARTRPWFIQASRVGGPIWTESYVFLGVGDLTQVLGLTFATPIYDRDHKIDSVITADFDLDTLCRYLKKLKVGRGGFAFVVENRNQGLSVIAHPQREILTAQADPKTHSGDPTLVSIDRFDDGRVRTMLAGMPGGSKSPTIDRPTTSRFHFDGKNYYGHFRRVSGEGKPRWIICTVLPEDEILGFAHRTNRWTLLVTIGALVLAILAGIYVSGQVARPLEHLAREATKVGHLRLAPSPVAHSFVLEVDRLAEASEEMKSGLRSFRKYVPAELVRTLIDSRQDARLGGVRRRLTIFFSDIENFTTISENSDPESIVEQLGEYFDVFNCEILASQGTVDKYIGDSVMAFWGAPEPVEDHAVAACLTAIRIQNRLRELSEKWQGAGKPILTTRIGIHTGEVIVGNIGNETRMNYTVVGDAVNLASRLEGMNKQFGTKILISEDTYQEAGLTIHARCLGIVNVKGRSGAVNVYELLEPGIGEPAGPGPCG